MSWTVPDDVIDRWVGDAAPEDVGLLQELIDDAEDAILVEYPTIELRIVGDTPPATMPSDPLPIRRLRRVVSSMVIRHLRNPHGYRQFQETSGPFSRGATLAGDTPGSLQLTDEERRMLGYMAESPRQKAFTVTPGTGETAWLGR